MRRWIVMALAGALIFALVPGCGDEPAPAPAPTPKTVPEPKAEPQKKDAAKVAPAKTAAADSVTLCGKCGQVKGSDACCKADAEA